MNIVFLHTDFRVYWLPRLRYLNTYLKEHGHQLHVIEIAGAGSPYAFSQSRGSDDISSWTCLFSELSMNDISPKAAQQAIFKELDKLRPDVVFAGAIAYPSGASAVRYCRTRRIPVVIFDNARMIDVPRNGIVNFIKRNVYKNVDAVLIPAPSHCPDFEFWGFALEQMYLGLNVVDNHFWKTLSLDVQKEQEVQEKLKLPERFVLGVGRQITAKNWLASLQAYFMANPNFSLLLVGDGPERPAINQYLRENNLEERVQVIDFQSPDVLAILYKKALATILPSKNETWGLVINESMACGSPVIVSTKCGCCETLCQDGITGFQVNTDVDSIANAFTRIPALSDEQLLAMRQNAEELVSQWGVERFSESVMKAAEHLNKRRVYGFHSLLSRVIVTLWKGRYRPV